VRTQLEGKLAEIRSRENQLHSEGNLFITRRESLKSNRNKLASRVESLESEIREECENIFPFCLCPTISNLLQKQLTQEKKLERQTIIQGEIKAYRNEIFEAVQELPQLDNRTLIQLEKLIDDLAKPRTELPPELKEAKRILGLAETTSSHIQSTLQYAEKKSKLTVRKLSLELHDVTQHLRKITIEISKIPKDEQIKPIFEELAILNQDRGVLQQKEILILKKINNLKEKLKENQKELDKLIERQTSQNRLHLVDKIQLILDVYLKKLTRCKIEQLQKSVTGAFNSLSRKNNMIERVEIDPISFAVILYDQDGETIPKERLSSGEKQLYAVSMLWALAKTSGRPLPVIVDTPLGRLDSDHRFNLVNNYFPEASHQVVLLSTDTEVDQKLFSSLKPYVSHCYHLKYDSKSKSTGITEEYFWAESNICMN
jgi:DNA sulfur modification protein DndD